MKSEKKKNQFQTLCKSANFSLILVNDMKIMADQLKREGQILAHYYRRIYKLEKEIPSNYQNCSLRELIAQVHRLKNSIMKSRIQRMPKKQMNISKTIANKNFQQLRKYQIMKRRKLSQLFQLARIRFIIHNFKELQLKTVRIMNQITILIIETIQEPLCRGSIAFKALIAQCQRMKETVIGERQKNLLLKIQFFPSKLKLITNLEDLSKVYQKEFNETQDSVMHSRFQQAEALKLLLDQKKKKNSEDNNISQFEQATNQQIESQITIMREHLRFQDKQTNPLKKILTTMFPTISNYISYAEYQNMLFYWQQWYTRGFSFNKNLIQVKQEAEVKEEAE